MAESLKAKEPFRFYARYHLDELTGLKASNLEQLLEFIKQVSDSSIYHHTHRFLQQHQYLSPEPPNDFAYWVKSILGDDDLGERLDSIDTVRFLDIQGLRNKLIQTIEDYLKENPSAKLKFAKLGSELHFMNTISFILPTNYIAHTLKDFAEMLKKVSIDSIYFHIFEARIRLKKQTNDFSFWIENSIGNKPLAERIARLDPYTHTLEDLRNILVRITEREL